MRHLQALGIGLTVWAFFALVTGVFGEQVSVYAIVISIVLFTSWGLGHIILREIKD